MADCLKVAPMAYEPLCDGICPGGEKQAHQQLATAAHVRRHIASSIGVAPFAHRCVSICV
eukprot:123115-Amphidinium_carterae.1